MSLLGVLTQIGVGYATGGVAGAISSGQNQIQRAATSGMQVSPGFLGAFLGTLGKGTSPAGPALPAAVVSGGLPMNTGMTAGGFANPAPALDPWNITGIGIGQVNIGRPALPPGPGMVAPGNSTQSGPGTGVVERDPWTPGSGATPCHSGYHYNKTGYFTKRYGWIPKGTVCVKNRKRNPLNPRALSHSMARLSSAKCAARFLDRVEISKPTRRRGCGCK